MSTLTPTFFGFHNAQRALLAAQTGMNLVNHNISNANTKGYSRQRMDLGTAEPYQMPTVGVMVNAQVGQGVLVEQIIRMRDNFLDTQYRQEQGIDGELKTLKDVIQQVEGVVGEPSFQGLASSLQGLFDSMSDMRNNPQSQAARTAFIQKMLDTTSVFQQQGKQLADMHANLVGKQDPNTFKSSQLGIRIESVNASLATIADLNRQINVVMSSGATPNDLLDQRNTLLENLAKVIAIEVKPLANNEQVQISIAGELMVRGNQQLNSLQLVSNPTTDPVEALRKPSIISTVNGGTNITDSISTGEVKGVLDMAGGNSSIENVWTVMTKLSSMYEVLADNLNTIQSSGRDLNGDLHTGTDTFATLIKTDASYTVGPKLMFMKVNEDFKLNTDKIALAADDSTAPSNFAGKGDSRNAARFAALKSTVFVALNNNTIEGYHQTMVSRLGTDSKSIQDREAGQKDLLTQLDGRRQAVAGVNLDEEAMDLVRFQRMFEASSRIFQAVNQMYQEIINMSR